MLGIVYGLMSEHATVVRVGRCGAISMLHAQGIPVLQETSLSIAPRGKHRDAILELVLLRCPLPRLVAVAPGIMAHVADLVLSPAWAAGQGNTGRGGAGRGITRVAFTSSLECVGASLAAHHLHIQAGRLAMRQAALAPMLRTLDASLVLLEDLLEGCFGRSFGPGGEDGAWGWTWREGLAKVALQVLQDDTGDAHGRLQ